MWMTSYIQEIKRQFRDVYGFAPVGGTQQEPLFNDLPAGTYPMVIEGKTDYVKITDQGQIECCIFEAPETLNKEKEEI